MQSGTYYDTYLSMHPYCHRTRLCWYATIQNRKHAHVAETCTIGGILIFEKATNNSLHNHGIVSGSVSEAVNARSGAVSRVISKNSRREQSVNSKQGHLQYSMVSRNQFVHTGWVDQIALMAGKIHSRCM